MTLPNGKFITPYTNDDTSEDQPIIFDNEGDDETQLLEGMKHESNQMKLHDVYDEVDAFTVDEMGTQKERTRSTKPNRRKRLHREDRGRRLRLRLYTNVHDTPDTSRTTNVTTKLDSATR